MLYSARFNTMTRMEQGLILILVIAHLTLAGANDLGRTNCTDKDGAPCKRDYPNYPPYYPSYDTEKAEELAEKWIYISIGIVVGVMVLIGTCVLCCLFCAFCPAYRNRKKNGAVYSTTTIQQQPATVYPQQPQRPYNPQQLNFQSGYPGIVYSPGSAHPQQQQEQQQQQQQNNEPYYNTITEYQQTPGSGQTAGDPAAQPSYYQNAPRY